MEHFVSLVGVKAAENAVLKAARAFGHRADGTFDPFDVECVVADRPARHGRSGVDRLSLGEFADGSHRRWRFITRMSVDERGGTNTGADMHPRGETLEQALERFHGQP